MTTLDALRAPVQEMLRTGRSTDDILAFLRKSGCSKIDCLAVLEDFAGWITRRRKQQFTSVQCGPSVARQTSSSTTR